MTAARIGAAVGAFVAGTSLAQAQETGKKSHSLTIMGFNIWNVRNDSKIWDPAELAKGNFVYNKTMQDLLRGVAPDVLVMPELYNNSETKTQPNVIGDHVRNTLDILNGLPGKSGSYQKNPDFGDREGSGMVFAGGNTQNLGGNTVRVNPGNGFSDVVIEGRHFNYQDEASSRTAQAKELVEAARGRALPTITVGDFNAGDLSERGLLSIDAQIQVIQEGSDSPLYSSLAEQYMKAGDEAKARQVIEEAYPGKDFDSLTWKEKGDALKAAYLAGKDIGLKDETYAVASNQPLTLNILKKQYQLMQLDRNRELFKPSQMGDGRATWTSDGEDATNTWTSWDRVNIDHIMVSRPYAKWVGLADNGKWSGTLTEGASLPGGGSLSDHEPVAQELIWNGPRVEEMEGGKVRLTFDNGASGFDGAGEFKLSRNNKRTDAFLGQLSDENVQPIYQNPDFVPQGKKEITQDELAVMVSYAIYDRHDITKYLAELKPFIPKDKMEAFNQRLAGLLVGADTGNGAFRKVIDDYFQAHRDEFPDISDYTKMSWKQWGYILIDHLKTDLTFNTVAPDIDPDVLEAIKKNWNELRATLGLDDPATRARLSQLTGIDFENDPNAPLKLQLACLDKQQLSLQGAREMCVDDHSRFKDIVIADGKTVAIDESEALGSTDGTITLADGGIRTAGPDDKWASWVDPVTKIDKAVRLEGLGWIDISHPTVPVAMMQAISGKGTLEKRGAGTLNLMAANSYTGGTIVTAGTLRAGVAGAFVDNTAYAANGGVLDLNGFDLTMSFLTGAGGTVRTGGAALDIGTLAPGGDGIGTLTIDGDLTLKAGSTYLADIAPDGKSDKVAVTGKAALEGGNVYISKLAGTYMPGQRYTILTADGGITGTFGNLSQNMPFVDLGLTYDPRNVYLDIARNDVAFAGVGETRNQKATAAAIEALGAGNKVFDTVVLQDSEADARMAFDQLSGEIHASAKTALINDSRLIRDAVNDRLRAAFDDVAASDVPVMSFGPDAKPLVKGDAPTMAAWGKAFGTWSETEGDGNAASLDQSTGGFVTGFDAAVAGDWRLGAMAGYSRTSFDAKGSGNSDNYHAGVYGGAKFDALSFRSGLAYSWHTIETSRSVAFPGFEDKLKADYDAGTFQAFGELGYRIDMERFAFEPFANLAHVRLKTDGFSEKGGAAALTAESETTGTTFTTLGLRASAPFTLGTVDAEARGTMGWQHAYGDTAPVSTLAFDGGNAFTIAGAPLAEDTGLVEAGFDVKLSKRTTLGMSYTGQFGSEVKQNGVDARFSVKF
ncbi:autotransporter domain-containing protein [Phyllobacterium leguminum]|nr:autotransporter domain-containing protein [Phyllobacterium leguminum]